MYTILIIEDEPRVASLLMNGLEENGYQTMVAYDGLMGLRLFQAHTFNLVISDIVLPKMDGFELAKEIRKSNPNIPILMLTALGSTNDKLDGFDAGADDYMVKPFDFRELNARIKVLLKRVTGNVPELPQELVYADLRIDLQRKDVERNGIFIKLSPKEYNLLLYMVENAERVLSRVEIAEKVWNTHFDTGTNFIDVYINYLRKKIDRDFEPKLIHTKAIISCGSDNVIFSFKRIHKSYCLIFVNIKTDVFSFQNTFHHFRCFLDYIVLKEKITLSLPQLMMAMDTPTGMH